MKELQIDARLIDPEKGVVIVFDANFHDLVGLTVEKTGFTYYRQLNLVNTFEKAKPLKKKLTTTKAVTRAAIVIAAITALTIIIR